LMFDVRVNALIVCVVSVDIVINNE
jgi:hypothetical protein